jgi:mannose/fructose/N-acetylgalactosamine-specific phosphotransferase system component IIC
MTAAVITARLAPFTTRAALTRAVIAGTAWGLTMGIGLALLSLHNCGGICIPDAALTTVISIVAGILTIGPVAAVGRRA